MFSAHVRRTPRPHHTACAPCHRSATGGASVQLPARRPAHAQVGREAGASLLRVGRRRWLAHAHMRTCAHVHMHACTGRTILQPNTARFSRTHQRQGQLEAAHFKLHQTGKRPLRKTKCWGGEQVRVRACVWVGGWVRLICGSVGGCLINSSAVGLCCCAQPPVVVHHAAMVWHAAVNTARCHAHAQAASQQRRRHARFARHTFDRLTRLTG